MASDNSLIEQAIENYQLGDFNQAAQICHELIKVDPNDYEALHLLGIILHEAGLNTQAADILKQALENKKDTLQNFVNTKSRPFENYSASNRKTKCLCKRSRI